MGAAAMRKLGYRRAAALGLALLSPAALAATQEEALTTITEVMVAVFVGFVATVIVGVYFADPPGRH
jgi:hypothetical protein